MLSLIPQEILKMGFFIALAAVVLGIVVVVKNMLKGSKKQKVFNAISLACVLIMAVSWFMNFGWFRFALTFMPVPLVHIAFFVVIINLAAKYTERKIYIAIILTQITFLMTYLFFPDGGDIGGMYVLFGRIHNDVIAGRCFYISAYSLVANVALMITLIIMTLRAKKKITIEEA